MKNWPIILLSIAMILLLIYRIMPNFLAHKSTPPEVEVQSAETTSALDQNPAIAPEPTPPAPPSTIENLQQQRIHSYNNTGGFKQGL